MYYLAVSASCMLGSRMTQFVVTNAATGFIKHASACHRRDSLALVTCLGSVLDALLPTALLFFTNIIMSMSPTITLHWQAFQGMTQFFSATLRTPTSPFMPPMHSSPYQDNNTRPKLSSTQSTSVNDSSASNPSTRQANFRVVVTNVDGARGKRAEIEHLCDYMDPDVIIMCETKIVSTLQKSSRIINRPVFVKTAQNMGEECSLP